MEVPQNRWSIRENPLKMDDLGVPRISGNQQMAVEMHSNVARRALFSSHVSFSMAGTEAEAKFAAILSAIAY